jgi:hypothetical protein
MAYFPLTRHWPHRKRRLQQIFVAVGTCLPSHCLTTIVGYTDRPTDSPLIWHGPHRKRRVQYLFFVSYCNVLCHWGRSSDCWLVLLTTSRSWLHLIITLSVSLHRRTHKVFSSHNISSQADLSYSSVDLVPLLIFSKRLAFKVKVTLRLTVSQSVSLGVEPHLGLMTRYLALFDSYELVSFCGAPSLTRGRVCLLSESLPALVSHLLQLKRCLHFTC